MTSREQAIGEAVAALTARLSTWGVDDANQKAHEYVTDMLRAGWRWTPALARLANYGYPTPPRQPRGSSAAPTAAYLAARNPTQGNTP